MLPNRRLVDGIGFNLFRYLGITIAFAENLSTEGGSEILIGAGFIFLSALTFAIYIAGIR